MLSIGSFFVKKFGGLLVYNGDILVYNGDIIEYSGDI